MRQEVLYYTKTQTPLGNFMLVASQKGLLRIILWPLEEMENMFPNISPDSKWIESPIPHKELIAQLHEYFQGKRRTFSVELDLRGTPFQIQVWRALQEVRYGETATYGEIARKIQKPNASRAVGNACRTNPIPILIPCHRIIGKNGDLTGFRGGLELKRQLLALEAEHKK